MINKILPVLQEAGAAVVNTKGFSWFWSILVPGTVLLVSIVATFMLYFHFSKKRSDEEN